MKKQKWVLLCMCVMLSAVLVFASVGPGVGAGTSGVVLGLFASIFIALFTVVWYPLKRLFKKNKPEDDTREETNQ